MRLIDADALLSDVIKRYCDGCDRRKGIKNGKQVILYEIGGVPCRACGTGDMIDEIEDAPTVIPAEKAFAVTVADVRPVVRGEWRFEKGDGKTCTDGWVCTVCNCVFHTKVPYFEDFNFCPNCGADMRSAE